MKFALVGSVIGVVLATTAQALAADGAAVYSADCAVCHNSLSPKLGDKAAWAPRIALGEDALIASVIKGKGMMTPRAGKSSLTDDEIKAAVEYIESKSK